MPFLLLHAVKKTKPKLAADILKAFFSVRVGRLRKLALLISSFLSLFFFFLDFISHERGLSHVFSVCEQTHKTQVFAHKGVVIACLILMLK